ncbi:MAG TPA: hypothetical protein VLH09_00585, partial [Bryobacteraceae bacterium]|nr:hypothetical protein [Bryobacteraceae bacterium]
MAVGTTAAIIGAATGGAGIFSSLFGAHKQSKAASQAADMQAAAAQQAAQGVDAATAAVNPQIQAAADAAAAGVDTATGDANRTLADVWAQIQGFISPYQQAGQQGLDQLAALLSPDSEFRQQFKFTQDDPSYQFRLQEGQKALERSAAARGGSMGGAALKAIARYGQDFASTEYQRAFDRFQQDRATRFNMLAGIGGQLAGIGQTSVGQLMAAGQNYGNQVSANTIDNARYGGGMRTWSAGTQADNTLNAARYRGEAGMGAANARAAGKVAGANAWAQGV